MLDIGANEPECDTFPIQRFIDITSLIKSGSYFKSLSSSSIQRPKGFLPVPYVGHYKENCVTVTVKASAVKEDKSVGRILLE